MAVTTKAHGLDSLRGPRSKHWSASSTLPSTATPLPLPNQAWRKVRFKHKCPSEPQRCFLLAIPELVQRQSLAARRLGIVHANLRCAIKARDSLAKSSRLNKTPPLLKRTGSVKYFSRVQRAALRFLVKRLCRAQSRCPRLSRCNR